METEILSLRNYSSFAGTGPTGTDMWNTGTPSILTAAIGRHDQSIADDIFSH